jgi:hypothetical protein
MPLGVLLGLDLFLVSCASVPDIPLCTDLGNKGYCETWLSRKGQYVDEKNLFQGKKWSQLRAESVLCPANECFVPLKQFIANYCHQNKDCANGAGKWGN